jgi:hypothetical protein
MIFFKFTGVVISVYQALHIWEKSKTGQKTT